ncbi:ribosomal-protein-alanine N-acetyltransferase [Bhargavaea cecembensis DSE10]|uniref:Ribosomal-protein-alanine N-acetyltransferase n=1 Tax=Bhargavaea cecembensis DSE10 TaxID=1235279 RepID=M7P4C7_9BACL|nr:ribosomal protein S18-alanine N-acetyltransferase [Bhargavaea cecembensis]EMR05379.1 ribosomal-protein-alanine N-acetyltransferase [Bhargavaea cecembensis DSE10]
MSGENTPVIAFRPMQIADVPAVYRVETDAFSSPWTMEAFEQEMLTNEYAYYLLAQDGEEIIGYCGAWLILDECHITNVAVLSAYRGHGIGEALMREMMRRTARKGAATMTLEVRVSNDPALGLYRKLGFKDGGIRRGYYTDNGEDALVMWTELNEDE